MFLKTICTFIFTYFICQLVWAEEDVIEQVDKKQEDEQPVRVSVLGYHDFTVSSKATEMRLPTSKFRQQLQDIKDNKLNVITLDDFISWKKGEKKLPARSVLLTIDDGWKSVYTDAYPILQEFNYPFTIYLYKNYVDGGGKALTTKMIREMQDSGLCSIGSHSASHPFPSKFRSEKKKGEQKFTTFLEKEFGDSKIFLENKFLQKVTTYAYPGGFHTEDMFPVAEKFEYQFLFTVMPGKITIDSPNHLLDRYIILGTHDYIFRNAISFKGYTNQTPAATQTTQTATSVNPTQIISPPPKPPVVKITTNHPVFPVADTSIQDRTPEISADLKGVRNLEPDSIVMNVTGFGKVPIKYDTASKKISWQVDRYIHAHSVDVKVSWKLQGESNNQPPLKWTFLVDRAAAYQPKNTSSQSEKAK